MVARLIPQAAGSRGHHGRGQKGKNNQQVTIRVVTDQRHDVLPPREVEGELVYDDESVH